MRLLSRPLRTNRTPVELLFSSFPEEEVSPEPPQPELADPGLGFSLALVSGGSLVLLFVIFLLVLPDQSRKVFTEASQFSGYLIVLLSAAAVGLRSPRGRVQQAWLLIALALLCNVVAEAIFGYLVLVQHQEAPTPSWADPFYLAFYPIMAVGISLLPAAPTNGMQRLKLGLDAFIVAGALLSASWFFLIGPTFFQGADSLLGLYISLAYPVGDLVLVLALVVLALRGVQRGYRPVFIWLAAGMLCIVYADSLYAYLGLQNAYVNGTAAVDTGWVAGALLIALAPLYQLARFGGPGPAWAWLRANRRRRAGPLPSESLLRIVLPYVPVAGLFVLVGIAQPASSSSGLFPGLEALALIVIALIIVRQVITLRENARLARRQREALAKLAAANREVEQQQHSSAEHARYLEEAIEHLKATHARVAQGDYSVRAQIMEGGALFPLALTLNLMLDRLERLAQDNQQQERLARVALTLAHVSRRVRQGDATAMQSLSRPSGTPLDEIAHLLVSLQQRVNGLGGELHSLKERLGQSGHLQAEMRLLTDSLSRLTASTQENADAVEEQYRQLERLAEEAERALANAPPGSLVSGPLLRSSAPLSGGASAGPTVADLLPVVRACVAQAERYCQDVSAFATASAQTNEQARKMMEQIRTVERPGD